MMKVTTLNEQRQWAPVSALDAKELDRLRHLADMSHKTIPEYVSDLAANGNETPEDHLIRLQAMRDLPSVRKILEEALTRQSKRVLAKMPMLSVVKILHEQARGLERECDVLGRAAEPELRKLLARAAHLLSGLDGDLIGKFVGLSDEVSSARREIPLGDLAAAWKSRQIKDAAPRRRRPHQKLKLQLVIGGLKPKISTSEIARTALAAPAMPVTDGVDGEWCGDEKHGGLAGAETEKGDG
jgi:hypothetical protein